MLAPDRVTVPEVVLVAPAVPARFAEEVPLWKSKAVVLVKLLDVPVIVPPVSFTPLTVSLLPPMPKVPPVATSTLAVSLIWLAELRVKVPVPLTRTSAARASTAADLLRDKVPALTVVRPV